MAANHLEAKIDKMLNYIGKIDSLEEKFSNISKKLSNIERNTTRIKKRIEMLETVSEAYFYEIKALQRKKKK
jgi:archaellum component FlaC